MNAKETELHRIIDTVVECCSMGIENGSSSITREDILGKSRSENIVMTRCILVDQIISAGYSVSTAAFILDRTVQSIRNMIKTGLSYKKTSRAYRIAYEEAARKCKEKME